MNTISYLIDYETWPILLTIDDMNRQFFWKDHTHLKQTLMGIGFQFFQ